MVYKQIDLVNAATADFEGGGLGTNPEEITANLVVYVFDIYDQALSQETKMIEDSLKFTPRNELAESQLRSLEEDCVAPQFWKQVSRFQALGKVFDKIVKTDHNGLPHCEDGPALVLMPHGGTGKSRKCWYIHGKRHRISGPAREHERYPDEYFLDGKRMTREEWAQDLRVIEYQSRTQEGAEEWLKRM